jgi:hypothetical protein
VREGDRLSGRLATENSLGILRGLLRWVVEGGWLLERRLERERNRLSGRLATEDSLESLKRASKGGFY